MKKAIYIFFALLLLMLIFTSALILIPLENPPLVSKRGSFAIESINVVDIKNGSINYDMTVLIDEGQIIDIVPSKNYLNNNKFTSVSARGKYLIPGLWDMHTHGLKISPQIHHPLFIANGITAVRDLSGCMHKEDSYWACSKDRVQWTDEVIAGARVSPRYILQSSYQTNGGNEVPEGYPSFFSLQKEEDAQELVAFYKAAGVDFIKVYSELSPQQYNSLVHAATENGIDIAGHKPIKISLKHAIDSGQKSIEHGRLFLFECYENIESLRELENPIRHYNAQLMGQMLEQQNDQQCNELMNTMAASETWWAPTLTTLKMGAYANDSSFRTDPRLDEIPYIIKALIWFPDADGTAKRGFNDNGQYVHKAFYEQALHQVNQANQLGVKLLAGTDSGDTYVFSGSGLHDELSMLVDAGLSPLAALQAATISAATFSRLDNKFGTIEIGKTADLLLLNSNPLKDIKNTKDIFAVMQNGHFYDKAALDILKEFVEDQANSIQINIRFLWDALYSPLMRKQLAD